MAERESPPPYSEVIEELDVGDDHLIDFETREGDVFGEIGKVIDIADDDSEAVIEMDNGDRYRLVSVGQNSIGQNRGKPRVYRRTNDANEYERLNLLSFARE